MAIGGTAEAAGFQSPPECQAYTGDAHLNCLYAYIEMQKDKVAKVEDELKSQKGSLGQLRDQVDRLSERPTTAPAPVSPAPVYTYPPAVVGGVYGYSPLGVYAYPPIGFSLYVGPRLYGPPYYLYRHHFYAAPRVHRR